MISTISVPELVVGQVAQVHAVEQHPSRVGVVEPGEQPRHRGLARPGLADKRHRLPGGDVEVEVRQHDRLAVAEPHRVERHPRGRTARPGSSAGSARLGDRRLLLKDAGELLQRRGGALEGVVELRHVLQRVEEPLQVQQERGEHADLDVAVEHPQAAVAEHDAGDDVRPPSRCPGAKTALSCEDRLRRARRSPRTARRRSPRSASPCGTPAPPAGRRRSPRSAR